MQEQLREDWKNVNFGEHISYKDYADLRMKYSGGGNRGYFNDDLRRKVSKVNLSPFDRSGSIFAQAWVMKADTYFQLNPMSEEEAIKFVALHLEGVAHEWWHHDTITLGHDQINTYVEFIEKVIDGFDGKDPKLNFKNLAQLRQTGSVDQYIAEFLKLFVLVTNIFERRRIVLFMDELTEPLKGWVKGFNPATLSEAIKKAQSMAPSFTSSSRSYSHPKLSAFLRDKDNKPPPRMPSMDKATR